MRHRIPESNLSRTDVLRLVTVMVGPAMPFVPMLLDDQLPRPPGDGSLPPVVEAAFAISLVMGGPVLAIVVGVRLLMRKWRLWGILLAGVVFLSPSAMLLSFFLWKVITG